jgi:hypothetical protein
MVVVKSVDPHWRGCHWGCARGVTPRSPGIAVRHEDLNRCVYTVTGIEGEGRPMGVYLTVAQGLVLVDPHVNTKRKNRSGSE